MLKIVILFLILAFSLGIISAIIYFWIETTRKWKREDEEFNKKKLKEAMKELQESNELITGMDWASERDITTVSVLRNNRLEDLEEKY